MTAKAVTVAKPKPATVAAPPAEAATMLAVIERAARDPSVDVGKMTSLYQMLERAEAARARRAFDDAIAAAKATIPVIGKNREVDYTPNGKPRVRYRHEDLAEIARVVTPILAEHGLSYRYRTHTEGGLVTVTCIVSHRDGHSEENSLSSGRDDTGGKNAIQQVGSAITYLQRYTLKAALGLAASDDDDGQKTEAAATVTPDQADELATLCDHLGVPAEKVCEFYGLEKLADVPAAQFERVRSAINIRGRKMREAAHAGS